MLGVSGGSPAGLTGDRREGAAAVAAREGSESDAIIEDSGEGVEEF